MTKKRLRPNKHRAMVRRLKGGKKPKNKSIVKTTTLK